MEKKIWLTGAVFLFSLLVVTACNPQPDATPNESEAEEPGVEASKAAGEDAKEVEAIMINQDNDVIGSAVLTQKPDGVLIQLEATDLPPGKHGFHIHEKGVCEPPTFETAGGHFNPTNAKHGFDDPEGPHAGDLLNIEVDEDGTVSTETLANMVTLKSGQKNSLLDGEGTALMIHSKPDDYVSQPSGDAGERIACAVIGKD
ncbi:superoxide dismutase family protein [Lentibacillus saliphilus]|uniref:superoxide dismutase family protein n=1 Tax=Lentibacillus saliphilus TaxID=2737028 RepID=UPI001C2F1947|nr:superoxide dismutase family protein [Lentibacillus saliphilus]